MSSSVFTWNPFTTVYDGLLSIINTKLAALSLVKAGNIISASGSNPSFKPTHNTADMPEVMLLQAGWGYNPFGASGNNRDVILTQVYPVAIKLESLDVIPTNDIKLAIGIALTNAGPHLGITAPGDIQFIDFWRITSGTDHQVNPQIPGTQTIMAIEVTMRVVQTVLQGL